MIVRDKIDWLKQRIAGADGIPSLLQTLEDLQRLEPEQEGSEDLDDLRLEALDALARLTQEASGEAAPIILRYLLPLCLRDKGEWRFPRMARRYDQALAGWFDRFPAIHRYALRASALEAFAEATGGAAAERACRLIGMLGYRNERLCALLLDLTRSGAEALRDVALHVSPVSSGASPMMIPSG